MRTLFGAEMFTTMAYVVMMLLLIGFLMDIPGLFFALSYNNYNRNSSICQ